MLLNLEPREGFLLLSTYEGICFPEPKDININMMPFVMEKTFEKSKLPEYLRPYWNNLIDKVYSSKKVCNELVDSEDIGKIGYLTIHESYVDENTSQRRAGIQTDWISLVNFDL